MPKEIERRFLVFMDGDVIPRLSTPGKRIIQGYFACVIPTTRVRIVQSQIVGKVNTATKEQAFLTLKGVKISHTCDEYEYEIPVKDAREMLEKWAEWRLEKTRYQVGPWEVDVFAGPLDGLVIAEIELPSEDVEFARPEWLGPELTNAVWSNLSLAKYGRPTKI